MYTQVNTEQSSLDIMKIDLIDSCIYKQMYSGCGKPNINWQYKKTLYINNAIWHITG